MAPILIPLIVVLSIVLMLVRPRGIPEVYWVGGGAVLLVVLRLIPLRLAGASVAQGGDVYLFLIGMMLLAELGREHGVFDWISAVAVREAQGSSAQLFTLIYFAGMLVTVFMSNDATAVVMTPAVLAAVRKAKVDPMPCLFGCALISNAASFVLPISNPANLVVFRDGMPTLERWLAAFALPSVVAIAATYIVLRRIFRRELAIPCQSDFPSEPLCGEARLVLAGIGAVIPVLMVASSRGWKLGLPTCLCALAVTAGVSLRYRRRPWTLIRGISWSTLALVGALFVLVNALVSVGALQATARWLTQASQLPPRAGVLAAGFAVGIGNNLVNNLPLGLICGESLRAAHLHGLIAQAVMIAIDLGPNLSVTGSLATILWLLALRREKLDVSFVRFLKVGAVAMPIALLLALLTTR